MSDKSTRRDFLTAGLALPAAALASSITPGLGAQAKPAPAGPSSGSVSYGVLGKTGLKPSRVGMGSLLTSDPGVIQAAVDQGINYFDTARIYQNGNNERLLGTGLKGRRKDVMISTKTLTSRGADALRDIDTSLKELGTDYVDIWYLHHRTNPLSTDKPQRSAASLGVNLGAATDDLVGRGGTITDDLVEAMQTAKKAGKARFIGCSTHEGHARVIPDVIRRLPYFDVLMTSYNFTMDPAIDALIESAVKAGLGVVGIKSMAGGFKPGTLTLQPGQKGYDTLQHEGAMLAALKWALRNRNLGTAVASITDLEQLDENLRAMSEPFSKADQQMLAAQLEYISPLYCRMCGACTDKCPQGLPVAAVLRFLTYAEGYGQFQLGRESFLSLPAEIRDVRCGNCTTCAIRCPNGVKVAERVRTAQELFA
jgi:uncharacterized protein